MNNKTKVISIVLFLSALMMFVSCQQQKAEGESKIEIIDGVKIIHNFQANQNKAFKPIEFVEDLSIGVEEGEENYMFNYPVDIDSDNEGNIFVLDYGDCLVKKYDAQGMHIKNFGGKGQGPGEFQLTMSFCISLKNRVYVGDFMSQKIEIFDSNGAYINTIKTNLVDQVSINKNEELIIGYKSRGSSDYKVIKYDEQNTEAKEIYNQEQFRTARISDGEFTYEIPMFVKWDINSSDNIYIGTADKYEISVFSSEGSLSFKFDLDYELIPATGEEHKKIIEVLNKISKRTDVQEFEGVSFYYPVFKFISIDEKDRIWIEHYQPYWHDRPKKQTSYDVFSSDGKFLFSSKINGHIYPQLIFKNGYVYSLVRDESGYSRAIRFRMKEN